ncbi:hypothetical protein TW95_gp1429 [Pandoravirus inopinatum]|uniref:Transmembrane protein n=1 Tax=Pandoravirus inopinatum TaxID=1605721 RepID=A0A0B5IZ75_9VIRU|nr:hypothetical protein TW95_gp1429 [Pandoravirus inopinatum]AJF98163.1 hypothetical protein [Pandoravirus inopinatum]
MGNGGKKITTRTVCFVCSFFFFARSLAVRKGDLRRRLVPDFFLLLLSWRFARVDRRASFLLRTDVCWRHEDAVRRQQREARDALKKAPMGARARASKRLTPRMKKKVPLHAKKGGTIRQALSFWTRPLVGSFFLIFLYFALVFLCHCYASRPAPQAKANRGPRGAYKQKSALFGSTGP